MSKSSFGPPAPLKGPDYEQIEAAVMETARGRWFLAEFARRNRTADTELLLKAIERLQNVVGGQETNDELDRLRASMMDMATAIARLRRDLFSEDSDRDGGRGTPQELDAIATETEKATHKILRIGERIQEIAWSLREQGIRASVCDALDASASEIFAACSFQDLTGQKMVRIVALLRMIEERLETVIDHNCLDDLVLRNATREEVPEQENDSRDDFEPAPQTHGPADTPASQHDIDALLSPATEDANNSATADGPEHESLVVEIDDSEIDTGDIAVRDHATPDPGVDEPSGMALETEDPGDPVAEEDGGGDLENFNRLTVELEAAAKQPHGHRQSTVEPGDIVFAGEDGKTEKASLASGTSFEDEVEPALPRVPEQSGATHQREETSGKAGRPRAGDPQQSGWDAEFNRLSPTHRQALFS